MEIYILLEERFGVWDFAGYCNSKEEAHEKKNKEIGYIKTEFIEKNKVVNNTMYAGGRYEPSPDLHDYVGLFYSFEEAQKACGEHAFVYPITVKM